MLATGQENLFRLLCERFSAWPDRRGEVWVTCPFCGKKPPHFSFSQAGYHCFVCNAGGSLKDLYEKVTHRVVATRTAPATPAHRRRKKPPAWLLHAERYVVRYQEHPQRYELWQSYKPLTKESIQRAGLGVGILPLYASRCRHERLIVPIFERGKVVGLRGRRLHCSCDGKWVTAAGSKSVLYGLEHAQEGDIIWIVENMVDCWLINQANASYTGVTPSTGISTRWPSAWLQALQRCKPALIIVAYDNDLAGQAVGKMRRKLEAEWQEKMRRRGVNARPPRGNGIRTANVLLQAGLPVQLFDWQGAPAKADIGWLFEQDSVFV